MKTMEELRALFQRAKAVIVLEEHSRAEEAATCLGMMAEHFREIYNLQPTILKKAKCTGCIDLYTQIAALIRGGKFTDRRVLDFFAISKAVPAGLPEVNSPSAPLDEAGWLGVLDEERAKPKRRKAPAAAGKVPAEPVASEAPVAPAEPVVPEAPAEPAEPAMPELDEEPRPIVPAQPAFTEPEAPMSEEPAFAAEEPIAPEEIVSGGTTYDPQSLSEFIGQEHVVKRVLAEIRAAKKQGMKHIDNILLFGNRGLGKSTLMELIAKELGVEFEFLDAGQFTNDVKSKRRVNQFFQRIAMENRPVVIGIDEIHAMPKHLQTGLLTLLNDRVYSYLDDAGQTHRLPIDEFTFIGATTDAQDVLATIKDRCHNLTFYLKDYSRDELRRIFLNKFAAKGMKVTESILRDCINRCRSSIREVNSIVDGLKSKTVNENTELVTPAMIAEYFKDIDRDPIGLSSKDLEILHAIEADPSGAIAEETLAARVYLSKGVLTEEFEPYLIKIGFISIISRGRSLTDRALDYLRDGYFDFGDGVVVGERKGPKDGKDGETEKEPPMPEEQPPKMPPVAPMPAPSVPEAPASAEPVAPMPEVPAVEEPAPSVPDEPVSAEPTIPEAPMPDITLPEEPEDIEIPDIVEPIDLPLDGALPEEEPAPAANTSAEEE